MSVVRPPACLGLEDPQRGAASQPSQLRTEGQPPLRGLALVVVVAAAAMVVSITQGRRSTP
jgi:hypothetical protein